MNNSRAQTVHNTIDLLIKTMHQHYRTVDKAVSDKQDGLPRGQMRILFALHAHDGAQCQRELAQHFEVSAANIARSLKTLEAGGYVTRESPGNDQRRNTVCLTNKGRNIVDRSIAVFERVDAMTFEGFSNEELFSLQSMLTRIHKNMQIDGSEES